MCISYSFRFFLEYYNENIWKISVDLIGIKTIVVSVEFGPTTV